MDNCNVTISFKKDQLFILLTDSWCMVYEAFFALFTAIERCIQVVRNWMHNNKLSLNEAKTEFLLFGKKQQFAKVNISHV